MLPLTPKELKSHKEANECYICGIKFFKISSNYINYRKVRDHCHYTGKCRGTAYSICNLKSNVPNEIPVVFHNGSKYDFDFIVKVLANKFMGNLSVLGKIMKSIRTFPSQ